MKQKIEIIKSIEINDDLVVIIGKKIVTKPKKCCDCPHFKYFGDLDVHYCDLYHGVVDEKDVCIESGM